MISTRSVALQGIGFGYQAVARQGFFEVDIPPPAFYGGLVYSPFRMALRSPFRTAVRW